MVASAPVEGLMEHSYTYPPLPLLGGATTYKNCPIGSTAPAVGTSVMWTLEPPMPVKPPVLLLIVYAVIEEVFPTYANQGCPNPGAACAWLLKPPNGSNQGEPLNVDRLK